MEIKLNITVDDTLVEALALRLDDYADGMSGDEKREMGKLAEQARNVSPENWSDELRAELAQFLLQRAGFDYANRWIGA